MPAEGGDRLADRPRLVRAELGERPLLDVRGARGPAPGRPRADACTAVRDRETVREPEHRAPIPVKNARSGERRSEPVRGRAEHQPADLVAVLAPDPLGDDRAHRVAGDDHVLELEHVDQRGHVVRAVDQRELLGLDAAPVPALVQRDHPEPSRQRLDRREPGQQPGAAQRVQQHDRGGVGGGPGVSVTYVDPRPGSSTIRPCGDARVGHVDPSATQTAEWVDATCVAPLLEHVTVLHVRD